MGGIKWKTREINKDKKITLYDILMMCGLE